MTESHLPTRFEWRAARATIPMATGLSVAALRASLLPRTWALLMTALILDNAVCLAIGLKRQTVARAWALTAARNLPDRFQDIFDKAWVGPLGLAAPVLDLLAAKDAGDAARALLGIACTGAIWGLFGGAICRIAMARMTHQPLPGYVAALKYTASHAGVIWGPPAMMGAMLAILLVILATLGAITHIPFVGAWLAWPIMGVMIVPAAILVLGVAGLILGWPLMLGAAMVEESDSFDALSRSQCYLFQAPVTWLLTIKIGFLVQTAGYFLVRWFLRALVANLRRAAGAFGLLPAATTGDVWTFPDPWTMPEVSSGAFRFWSSLIELAAVTWPIGFAFAFSAAIYLALKARVDLVAPGDVRIE